MIGLLFRGTDGVLARGEAEMKVCKLSRKLSYRSCWYPYVNRSHHVENNLLIQDDAFSRGDHGKIRALSDVKAGFGGSSFSQETAG